MGRLTEEEKRFIPKRIYESDLNANYKHDLSKLYEQAHSELSLQQTKRDQIIALYMSIFSLLIPFALSLDKLTVMSKGLIFLAVGIIGVIFNVIIIRYRIYKEIYWLSCETITCMINVKDERLNKDIVQTLFYKSLSKKGKNFFVRGKWSSFKYFKKNIFSSETLHYIVLDLLTSVLVGLGGVLVLPLDNPVKTIVTVCMATALFIALLTIYFYHCTEVYSVLKDGKDSSFNKAFAKAWFLHLYIDIADVEKDV